jgi:hypothetical protein
VVELFFDLVFVAAISQLAGPLGRHYEWQEVGRYGFLLLVSWWGWQGYVMYATRFGGDDTRTQLETMLQMVAVMFMAANAETGLDSTSAAGFAAAYGVMRLLLAGAFARAWWSRARLSGATTQSDSGLLPSCGSRLRPSRCRHAMAGGRSPLASTSARRPQPRVTPCAFRRMRHICRNGSASSR